PPLFDKVGLQALMNIEQGIMWNVIVVLLDKAAHLILDCEFSPFNKRRRSSLMDKRVKRQKQAPDKGGNHRHDEIDPVKPQPPDQAVNPDKRHRCHKSHHMEQQPARMCELRGKPSLCRTVIEEVKIVIEHG